MAVGIIFQVVQFYIWLIIAYILLSWFPVSGIVADIKGVLASVVEPYLGLFRKIIPPIGAIDFSPVVAILVLQFAARALARVLG